MIDRVLSIPVGIQQSMIYFVENGNGDAIMIDCGLYDERVKYFIERNDLDIKAILLTHGHFDHIMGLKIADNRPIDVFIGEKDAEMLNDESLNLAPLFGCKVPEIRYYKTLKEGNYKINGFDVRVIETPGHTAGSVCYLIEDRLFTGDTMFRNTYGRTDLPTGDMDDMFDSLKKLLSLDEKIKVYPGHGETTSIKTEREFYSDMLDE